MDSNFQRALAVVLQFEGGWSDNPKDPGGATMRGITLATFRRYYPKASKADLRAISAENIARIYRQDFWQAVNGDTLAAGVDLATFDAGVNSGPGRAKGWLKASIGGTDAETVKRLCGKRLGFMKSLAIWNTFGRGWSKRVAAVEAKGVAWALAAVSGAADVKTGLETEQKAAQSQASKVSTSAAGAGVSTAAGSSETVSQHVLNLPHWAPAALVALGVLLVLALIVRTVIHQQRAAAYAAEAALQGDPA